MIENQSCHQSSPHPRRDHNPVPAANLSHDAWPPSPSRPAAVVLLSNEFAVPAEHGVARDDRANLGEGFASDGPAHHGESPALVVVEPDALRAELLAEDLVLGFQALNHALLMLVEHAGEDHAEELSGVEGRSHRSGYGLNGCKRPRPSFWTQRDSITRTQAVQTDGSASYRTIRAVHPANGLWAVHPTSSRPSPDTTPRDPGFRRLGVAAQQGHARARY